jgi:hypothetical protein
MADIADNAETVFPGAASASRSAQPKRRASAAPAASAVTSDTESTLAPAGQRLAQPGGPPADESTLDLFHDDPKHALAQALEIDVRQDVTSVAEQPEAPKDEAEPVAGATGNAEVAELVVPAVPVAAAAPRRAVRAKRVVAEQSLPNGDAKADEAAAVSTPAESKPPGDNGEDVQPDAAPASTVTAPAAIGEMATAASATNHVVQNAGAAPADAAPSLMLKAAPEHDRAPALAAGLESTVNALHGEIADQRRATADLSRRMRWMLAGVTGALLVTVAAGVAQTLMLARLAADTQAQQQRIAQSMQDQQTALADALARLAAQPAVPALEPASAPVATRAAPPHHAQHSATHGHRVHPASH